MAVDLVLKRHDTSPPLKTTLKQVNQETKIEEAIDLKNAVKVTMIAKPPSPGVVVERECTGPEAGGIKTATGVKSGMVEAYWHQTDLETLGVWTVEFEIEWAEIEAEPGKVKTKQFQTVPNEGYRSFEVIADLGTA